METSSTLFERHEAVAILTVNRPQVLNALDDQTLAELGLHLAGCRPAGVRCLIITGAGERAFVAGADIAAMSAMSSIAARIFARRGQALMRSLEEMPIPVIAAVNGFALGGGLELALACDFIYAADSAKFGQPEINLGIIPGFGGTQRLARRIGIARARELTYTGATISAAEAERLGLVNRVLPRTDLLPEVLRVAADLAGKAPLALQQAKAAISAGADMALEDGCRYEAEAFALTFSTADQKEGMAAFLAKRKAAFAGR
ncbi:MAG: enoyl-CoA hydratase/isomerase family protein [Deltaproteobacteria bacterium]|nr:enoyl-CoA hydratase/isomerase family protein [Deltaproteobacteria bacterium]